MCLLSPLSEHDLLFKNRNNSKEKQELGSCRCWAVDEKIAIQVMI